MFQRGPRGLQPDPGTGTASNGVSPAALRAVGAVLRDCGRLPAHWPPTPRPLLLRVSETAELCAGRGACTRGGSGIPVPGALSPARRSLAAGVPPPCRAAGAVSALPGLRGRPWHLPAPVEYSGKAPSSFPCPSQRMRARLPVTPRVWDAAFPALVLRSSTSQHVVSRPRTGRSSQADTPGVQSQPPQGSLCIRCSRVPWWGKLRYGDASPPPKAAPSGHWLHCERARLLWGCPASPVSPG